MDSCNSGVSLRSWRRRRRDAATDRVGGLGLYAHVVGDITCVSASDGVAVTTGIIRHAWFRDFPGSTVVDTGVAITVADSGTSDALGFHFEFFDGREILPCEPLPPVIPLMRGRFTIR